MATVKHTHKLRRHKYSTGNTVYFCALADCHYKIECVMALGKKSICNICGDEFIMTEYTVKLAKPHCEKCSKIKMSGPDGKKHYVRRDSLPVMASLANESTDELRSRLDNAITPVMDDDI